MENFPLSGLDLSGRCVLPFPFAARLGPLGSCWDISRQASVAADRLGLVGSETKTCNICLNFGVVRMLVSEIVWNWSQRLVEQCGRQQAVWVWRRAGGTDHRGGVLAVPGRGDAGWTWAQRRLGA